MFFKKSKKVNDELQQELQKLREENEKLKMCIDDWKGSCRDNRDTIEYMFKLKELESERNESERNELTRELEFSRKLVKNLGKEIGKEICEHEKEKKILKDKIALLSCNVEMYKEQVEGVIEKHGVDYANSFLYLDK